MLKSVLAAISIVLLAAACAGTSMRASPEQPLLTPVPQFLAEQEQLRANLEEGQPRELNETEWGRFNRIQEQFTEILGDVSDTDELSSEEKEEVFRLRGRLITLMTSTEDEELICTRQTHEIGTRLKGKRRCTTRSQLEREEFSAQELMRYIGTVPQGVPEEQGGN